MAPSSGFLSFSFPPMTFSILVELRSNPSIYPARLVKIKNFSSHSHVSVGTRNSPPARHPGRDPVCHGVPGRVTVTAAEQQAPGRADAEFEPTDSWCGGGAPAADSGGHRGAARRPAGGATGTTRTPGPPHPHQPKPRGGWRRRRLDWDDSNPRPAGAAPSPHPSQPKPAAARRLAPPAPTEGGPAGLPFSGRPGRPPAAAPQSS